MYAGFATLESSKILMYDFHHYQILKRFPDSARLLFTDTDSLCYVIQCDDFYSYIMLGKEDYYTYKYDPISPLLSKVNKKLLVNSKTNAGVRVHLSMWASVQNCIRSSRKGTKPLNALQKVSKGSLFRYMYVTQCGWIQCVPVRVCTNPPLHLLHCG